MSISIYRFRSVFNYSCRNFDDAIDAADTRTTMISFSVLKSRISFCLCQHLGHRLSNIKPYASDDLTNRGKSTHGRPFEMQYFIRVSKLRPIIKQMNGQNVTQTFQLSCRLSPDRWTDEWYGVYLWPPHAKRHFNTIFMSFAIDFWCSFAHTNGRHRQLNSSHNVFCIILAVKNSTTNHRQISRAIFDGT